MLFHQDGVGFEVTLVQSFEGLRDEHLEVYHVQFAVFGLDVQCQLGAFNLVGRYLCTVFVFILASGFPAEEREEVVFAAQLECDGRSFLYGDGLSVVVYAVACGHNVEFGVLLHLVLARREGQARYGSQYEEFIQFHNLLCV